MDVITKDYPYNLFIDLICYTRNIKRKDKIDVVDITDITRIFKNIDYKIPSKEQCNALKYIVENKLNERCYKIVQLLYINQMSIEDVLLEYKISKNKLINILNNIYEIILSNDNKQLMYKGVDDYYVSGSRKIKINELNITQRGCNALKRANIFTIGDILMFVDNYGTETLKQIKNFGNTSYRELSEKLLDVNVDLKNSDNDLKDLKDLNLSDNKIKEVI